ncbi:hypothetical protein GCM10010377_69300 [Streptomyces viridiviolaceus]|nr:hypothetical protein GCM10010377_69300 [Streptomyces viridiviolaceus]
MFEPGGDRHGCVVVPILTEGVRHRFELFRGPAFGGENMDRPTAGGCGTGPKHGEEGP